MTNLEITTINSSKTNFLLSKVASRLFLLQKAMNHHLQTFSLIRAYNVSNCRSSKYFTYEWAVFSYVLALDKMKIFQDLKHIVPKNAVDFPT